MNLPFFYPEHPEFKAHVEFVAKEILEFHYSLGRYQPGQYKQDREREAEARAKDIVLWVTSKPVDHSHNFKALLFGYFAGAGTTITMVILILMGIL